MIRLYKNRSHKVKTSRSFFKYVGLQTLWSWVRSESVRAQLTRGLSLPEGVLHICDLLTGRVGKCGPCKMGLDYQAGLLYQGTN